MVVQVWKQNNGIGNLKGRNIQKMWSEGPNGVAYLAQLLVAQVG